jgi:hypothetical protein
VTMGGTLRAAGVEIRRRRSAGNNRPAPTS